MALTSEWWRNRRWLQPGARVELGLLPLEAVPPGTNDFIVSISGPASATMTLIVSRAMADALAAGASLADALAVQRSFADSIAATGTVADALLVQRNFADAVVAGASLAGVPLSVQRQMVDAISGSATVTDAIVIQKAMAAAIAGTATLADAVSVVRAFAEAITASATTTDALGVTRSLEDSIAGAAAVTDALGVLRGLVDSISGPASMTDAVVVARAMYADLAAAGSLTDALAVQRPLALPVSSAAATFVADLQRLVQFADTISGSASLTDNARVQRNMALATLAVAQFLVALDVEAPGSATFDLVVQALATMAPDFQAARTLLATMASAGTLVDPLEVRRNLSAALSAGAQVLASTSVLRAFAAPVQGAGQVVDLLGVLRALGVSAAGHTALLIDLTAGSGGGVTYVFRGMLRSLSMAAQVGETVPIYLALNEADTGLFPMARVMDDTGALITEFPLTHGGSGRYFASWVVPGVAKYLVSITSYIDAGHTTPAPTYLPTSDVIDSRVANTEIAAAVRDVDLSGSLDGSLGDALQELLGSAGGANYRLDNMVYSNGLLTSVRLRLFRTQADAQASTPGGTGQGEFKTMIVTQAPSATPGQASTVLGRKL